MEIFCSESQTATPASAVCQNLMWSTPCQEARAQSTLEAGPLQAHSAGAVFHFRLRTLAVSTHPAAPTAEARVWTGKEKAFPLLGLGTGEEPAGVRRTKTVCM